EEEGIEALMALLEKLDRERKLTAGDLEKVRAESLHRQPAALGEVQSLAELLNRTRGQERIELRLKIRARIKQLVSEIWMLVWDVTATIRGAELQIIFHSGIVKVLLLAWKRRGQGRGLSVGVGLNVVQQGEPLECPMLSGYRTNAKLRAWFTKHREEL